MREVIVPACVVYYFAYVNKRTPELPVAMARQLRFVHRFVDSKGLDIADKFPVLLTNRDRHFADTWEFRTAVERAKTLGAPLVLGDVEDMLTRTDPELIEDCIAVLLGTGISVFDARLALPLNRNDFRITFLFASREATRKRDNIDIGISIRKPVRKSGTSNQHRAARGTSLAAKRRAERVRPVVDEIRGMLPAGTELSATLLAKELNSRSILTDRGKPWSRNTADRLLNRLHEPNAT